MDLATDWITYDSGQGPVPAYRAKPAMVTEPLPAVLVIQEAWGASQELRGRVNSEIDEAQRDRQEAARALEEARRHADELLEEARRHADQLREEALAQRVDQERAAAQPRGEVDGLFQRRHSTRAHRGIGTVQRVGTERLRDPQADNGDSRCARGVSPAP